MNTSNNKQKRKCRTARRQHQRRRVRTNNSYARLHSRSTSTRRSHFIVNESVLRVELLPSTYADIVPSRKIPNVVRCIGGGGLPYREIIITTSQNGAKSKRVIKVRKTRKLERPNNPVRNR